MRQNKRRKQSSTKQMLCSSCQKEAIGLKDELCHTCFLLLCPAPQGYFGPVGIYGYLPYYSDEISDLFWGLFHPHSEHAVAAIIDAFCGETAQSRAQGSSTSRKTQMSHRNSIPKNNK